MTLYNFLDSFFFLLFSQYISLLFFEQAKMEYIRNTKGSSSTRCAQESSKVQSTQYKVQKTSTQKQANQCQNKQKGSNTTYEN